MYVLMFVAGFITAIIFLLASAEWRRKRHRKKRAMGEQPGETRKKTPDKKVRIDTYAKMAVTVLMVHGMALTTWSYILASHGMDPVVDVSSTIVREIVAPVITYLATNTVMNIFEKNKLSFSIPLNSAVIRKDGTKYTASEDDAQG